MLAISASSALLEVDGLRVDGVLALAGPSGAGKTTLLRAVAGLARPERGRIECAGTTWLDTGVGIDLAPERRRCGFVFQDQALFPHMTALRNVAYGARGDRPRALELLDRLGVAHRAGARPRQLSGGERQRVALARALAGRPRALLLDEPLSSLDPRSRAAATRELRTVVAEAGVPTVIVTHDFTEAALLADDVAVLDGGRVAQRGTASELASSPASAFVADYTGAVVLTGEARRGDAGLTRVELDGGGGAIESTDDARGRVAAAVHPWDIALGAAAGSAHNRLAARITGVTLLGNRARVGLDAGQPLVAEVTADSVTRMGLGAGARVEASWKAAATRLLPLGSARP